MGPSSVIGLPDSQLEGRFAMGVQSRPPQLQHQPESRVQKMSKLNSKLFKGKMMGSMRKSTENISGLLEPSVTTSPTGDPLSADVGDSGTCLPFFPSILSSDVSAGKDGNYQLKKKRSTLSFFKGKS